MLASPVPRVQRLRTVFFDEIVAWPATLLISRLIHRHNDKLRYAEANVTADSSMRGRRRIKHIWERIVRLPRSKLARKHPVFVHLLSEQFMIVPPGERTVPLSQMNRYGIRRRHCPPRSTRQLSVTLVWL